VLGNEANEMRGPEKKKGGEGQPDKGGLISLRRKSKRRTNNKGKGGRGVKR